MTRRHLLAIASLASLLWLGIVSLASAGGGCDPNAQKSEASGDSVAIRDCGFAPVVLFASPGTIVTWRHADDPPHNVVGVGWGASEPLKNGDTASHIFSTPGIYPYQCSIHPGMAGAVVVGDAATVAPIPAAEDAKPETPAQSPHPALAAAAFVAATGVGVLLGRRLGR